MTVLAFCIATFLLCGCAYSLLRAGYIPEQIHLAPGSEPDSMTVSWVTYKKAEQSLAKFRPAYNTVRYITAVGKQKYFSYHKNCFYTHYVTLRKLTPSTLYNYKVGSEDGWSEVYTFKSLPRPDSPDPFKVCIFGDLTIGQKGVITPFLIQAAKTRQIDLIIHAGDIAYDFHDSDRGNIFLNNLQEVFAQIPYMIAIGNHEREEDHGFHNLKHRFKMPNSEDKSNHFYSVDIGPVHFVGISTELYYGKENLDQGKQQWKWLNNDLKHARCNSSASWIVVYQHRPFYCSSTDLQRCSPEGNKRIRLGRSGIPGLEPLYIENGVDLVFSGHEHFYERFNPIRPYDLMTMVFDGHAKSRIHEAEGPINIITGAAGCPHKLHSFRGQPMPGSVVRKTKYGYTLLSVQAPNQVKIEQISVLDNNQVIDSLVLTKNIF